MNVSNTRAELPVAIAELPVAPYASVCQSGHLPPGTAGDENVTQLFGNRAAWSALYDRINNIAFPSDGRLHERSIQNCSDRCHEVHYFIQKFRLYLFGDTSSIGDFQLHHPTAFTLQQNRLTDLRAYLNNRLTFLIKNQDLDSTRNDVDYQLCLQSCRQVKSDLETSQFLLTDREASISEYKASLLTLDASFGNFYALAQNFNIA